MEKFTAPVEWYNLEEHEREAHSNGCGPGALSNVIPNSIMGLSIRRACDVHDWMYVEGKTPKDRQTADNLFLNNMRALIRKGSPWLAPMRNAIAWTMYRIVVAFGSKAFKEASNGQS